MKKVLDLIRQDMRRMESRRWILVLILLVVDTIGGELTQGKLWDAYTQLLFIPFPDWVSRFAMDSQFVWQVLIYIALFATITTIIYSIFRQGYKSSDLGSVRLLYWAFILIFTALLPWAVDLIRNKSPNSVFTLVTGTASVIGLFMTYESVRDLGRTIKNFDELAERIIEFAEQAKCDLLRHGTDSDSFENTLRIACYTPVLGFFALREHLFDRLQDSITATANGRSITKMVCLPISDLEDWHKLYIHSQVASKRTGRRIEVKDVVEANFKARRIIERMGPANGHFREKGKLPGYYFFVIQDRALVVTPLHLSRLEECEPIEELNLQMVGVEFIDRQIVQELQTAFRYHWDKGWEFDLLIPDLQLRLKFEG